MFHPLLKTAIRLFYTSVLLFAFADIASATSCSVPATVLSAYEVADTVMIVRVLSVQKIEALNPGDSAFPEVNPLRTMKVERVFKGNVKVNDELVFAQDPKINCSWTFREEDINNEFLLYVKAPKTNLDRWQLPGCCGRSKPVSHATEDLLYLDNLKTVRGKTRVSGKYSSGPNQNLVVAHRSIRIVGAEKVYETFTDEKGIFEIYDVPPGKYQIEPELAEGWRIDRWGVRLNSSSATRVTSPKSVLIVLEAKKHVSINLMFQPDNAVEGTVVGPTGKALANTCAYLRRPDEIGDERLGSQRRNCTDANGRFRIEAVTPGTYVLVLNQSGRPKASEPFSRVFYPGTTEIETATTITIGPGQTVKDIHVAVPALFDTVTVEGVLYYSDGQPGAKQYVRFEAIEKPGIESNVTVETDESGRFSFKIFKGSEGKLGSGIVVHREPHGNCSAQSKVLQPGQDSAHFTTQELRIEAQQDITNLVLRFPIPSCQSNPLN